MRLSRDEIKERLLDIVFNANGNDVSTIKEEDDIRSDIGLTSVGMLYLAISIEESFDIDFDDVNIVDFVTLKDVIDFIEDKLQ